MMRRVRRKRKPMASIMLATSRRRQRVQTTDWPTSAYCAAMTSHTTRSEPHDTALPVVACPCDGCPNASRCNAQALACGRFAGYIEGRSVAKWRSAVCAPTAELFAALFPRPIPERSRRPGRERHDRRSNGRPRNRNPRRRRASECWRPRCWPSSRCAGTAISPRIGPQQCRSG